MLADTARLYTELALKDKGFERGIAKARAGTKGLTLDTSRLHSGLGKIGSGLRIGASSLLKFGAVAAGLAATGLALAVKKAGDLEAELNTINTIAKLSQSELKGVGGALREMSVQTGKSTTELTSAYYDLISAGVKVSQAEGVLGTAATFATGSLSTTAEAVNLLTGALNVYGGGVEAAARYTDMFAEAVRVGKVTGDQIANSFAIVANIAKNYGIEIEEVAAAYGHLTAKNIAPAEGMTQMRSAILALNKPLPVLNKLMEKTGNNYAKLAKQKGLTVALEQLRKDLQGTGLSFVDVLGRVEALNFATATTGENFKGYQGVLDGVTHASDGVGEATRQAAERQKGLTFQLDKLKAIGGDVAITFGEALLPSVTRVSTAIGDLVTKHKGDIKAFAERLGSLADKWFGNGEVASGLESGLTFLKDLPWGVIKSGLKQSAEAAGRAVEIFKSLPPEVQGGLITLLAANKLTGGLVASGLGDLMKFALGSLRTITATHVTVIGGTVTGGGIPGAGVPGAPGGAGILGHLGAAALTVTGLFTLKEVSGGAERFLSGLFGGSGMSSDDKMRAAMDQINQNTATTALNTGELLGPPLPTEAELQQVSELQRIAQLMGTVTVNTGEVETARGEQLRSLQMRLAGAEMYGREAQAARLQGKIDALIGSTSTVTDAVQTNTGVLRNKNTTVTVNNSFRPTVNISGTAVANAISQQFSRFRIVAS